MHARAAESLLGLLRRRLLLRGRLLRGRLLILDAEEGLDGAESVVGLLEIREEVLEELRREKNMQRACVSAQRASSAPRARSDEHAPWASSLPPRRGPRGSRCESSSTASGAVRWSTSSRGGRARDGFAGGAFNDVHVVTSYIHGVVSERASASSGNYVHLDRGVSPKLLQPTLQPVRMLSGARLKCQWSYA